MTEPIRHDQPTVLRAASSADFLAALPRLVGMDTPESCGVVLFGGECGSRSAGAARLDLPERLDEQLDDPGPELGAWLRCVAELALMGDAAAVVINTASRLTKRPEASAHSMLTAVLADVLTAAGVPLKDALVVGSDGWASFADGATSPDLGRLEDITDSPLHDPSFQPPSIDDWREQHPGQTAEDPEQIDELAARMRAAGSEESRS